MFDSMTILPLEAPPTDGNLGPLPPSQLTDQEIELNELQAEQNNPNQAPTSVATHTNTIGIIYPPPDIKAIIQKTAKYVSDNGIEFEKKILAEKSDNARFNFLRKSNPYHAFYQQKLADLNPDSAAAADDDEGEAVDANPDPQEKFRVLLKPLEEPEPEKYTVRLPEGITGEELDIIKLTAQFVARNGESFFSGLQSKENKNPLFHFMKPTHKMFPFFNALVNVYSNVLRPPKDLNADFTTVRDRCLNRLEWDRSQEQHRKKQEDEQELERIEMAMIDWHDFEVVASINLSDLEDEEVTTTSEVSTMTEDEIVDMEMDEEEEVKLFAEGMTAASLEEEAAPLRIVKNWKRPEDRIPTERHLSKVVISPITGELIPINEMSEHMRISLIDPKFKEQKDRMFAKIRDTTLAHDDEIAKNIVGLARLRPDIFGTTEEEVSNAVKAEIEQTKQVVWDGHTGSISVPTVRPFPPPPNLALNLPCPPLPVQYPGVPLMQPMHHQHHQLLMPGPPQTQPSQFSHLQVPTPYGQMGMMQLPPMPAAMHPRPPPVEAQPPLPVEPEPKRQKLDESVLVPEDEFLAQHPGCATIRVSVPNEDELIEITVESLSEKVATLKEKIAGETQIPANKQKLSGKAGFLKDNMSIAHYNVGEGEVLILSLRERGGRKR